MKILYLAHRIPYPPNKGDKIRSFNHVKYLAARHELDLICLVDDPEDLSGEKVLRSLCRRFYLCEYNQFQAKLKGLLSLMKGGSISAGYFYKTAVQHVFDQWLSDRDYDAIICFSSPMAEYLFRSNGLALNKRSSTSKCPQLIMDFCDVDSDKWQQYAENAKFPLDKVYRLENKRLASYEKKIYHTFDHSLLVSEKEKELFGRVCSNTDRITVVRNGVDFKYFDPCGSNEKVSGLTGHANLTPESANSHEVSPTIVFTGAMDYHANVDGVCWFCRKVLPRLQEKFPNLKFLIVGSKPAAAVQNLNRLPGVKVTGFVDDIRDYYRQADICVVPLRLARGVQNKVLEAMAMGKAVVTTSKANDGIQAQDGTHLLIADSAEDFVCCTLKLLADRELNGKISSCARDFVVEQYDWQSNMAELSQLLKEEWVPTLKATLRKESLHQPQAGRAVGDLS